MSLQGSTQRWGYDAAPNHSPAMATVQARPAAQPVCRKAYGKDSTPAPTVLLMRASTEPRAVLAGGSCTSTVAGSGAAMALLRAAGGRTRAGCCLRIPGDHNKL